MQAYLPGERPDLAEAKLEQIPDCTQYLIEYSICTSVVLDIFQEITNTKSTPAVAGVSQGGAVP